MDPATLQAYGIDWKGGMARCLNDESLYRMLLSMFLEDDSFARAKAALAQGDRTLLFKCLHELKGASGNAALTQLYAAVCTLVELLRGGGGTEAEIEALFQPIEAAYQLARDGVELAVG